MIQRSRCPMRGRLSNPRSSSLRKRGDAKPAITLAELVAVIAVLAVALVVVAPAMVRARAIATTVRCEDHLLGFATGLSFYTAEHEDWLPGPNTSGVITRVASYGDGSGLQQSNVPVQSFDWMTPLALYDRVLPDNRADRWFDLWTQYRCPSQHRDSRIFASSQAPQDRTDFSTYPYPWPGCSYLMPTYFSMWGSDQFQILTFIPSAHIPVGSKVVPQSWEVQNQDYLSRIDSVGPPAQKVFVADGTRYLDAGGRLSTNVSPDPTYLGDFTTMAPWWAGSTAYGVARNTLNWDGDVLSVGSPSDGDNLPLSYRHPAFASLDGTGSMEGQQPATLISDGSPAILPGSGSPSSPQTGAAQDNHGAINTLFFDGHVERLNDRQSREISLWYPTGSVVAEESEGMTSLPVGYVIP